MISDTFYVVISGAPQCLKPVNEQDLDTAELYVSTPVQVDQRASNLFDTILLSDWPDVNGTMGEEEEIRLLIRQMQHILIIIAANNS